MQGGDAVRRCADNNAGDVGACWCYGAEARANGGCWVFQRACLCVWPRETLHDAPKLLHVYCWRTRAADVLPAECREVDDAGKYCEKAGMQLVKPTY